MTTWSECNEVLVTRAPRLQTGRDYTSKPCRDYTRKPCREYTCQPRRGFNVKECGLRGRLSPSRAVAIQAHRAVTMHAKRAVVLSRNADFTGAWPQRCRAKELNETQAPYSDNRKRTFQHGFNMEANLKLNMHA